MEKEVKKGKVLSIQDHLFKELYKGLDELDKIADRMAGYCDELDKIAEEEERNQSA